MDPRMHPRNPLDGGAQYPKPNIPSFADARVQSPAVGSGSFTAMLITLASTAIGVIIWLTYRYLRQRHNTELGQATKRNGNVSVATQVANAMHRAKGVAVWLKAIRYVQNGITDDHLFKKVGTGHVPSSYTSPANPFLAPADEDDEDKSIMDSLSSQGHLSTAQVETNLAIIIAVDAPWSGSGSGLATSVQGDGERLAQMFGSMSYFGGAYKTVVLTTKALAPSSTNLTEVLLQLAASKRTWNNVVVYVSAPARAFPKDFIDASLFRNAHTDLTKVERFSRSSVDATKEALGTAPSKPFVGSVGVEFLALRDAPDEPTSWVDLALLLDRIRLATRRHADDPPIVCLFDGVWSPQPVDNEGQANGVRGSIAWMDTDALPVKFDTTESAGAPQVPQERLTVSRAELEKFRPDDKLMSAIEALTLPDLLEQSLRLYDALAAVVLSSEGGSRTTTSLASAAKKKHHTLPGAAPPAWQQRAASLWCDAILKGYHQSQQGTPTPPSATLPSSISPGAADDDVMGGLVAPPSHSGDVAGSLFHYGRMTTETIAMHLRCSGVVGPNGSIGTIMVFKGAKAATVPVRIRPVPLATQVAMMPRPLHTVPSPALVHITSALSASEAALIARLAAQPSSGSSCIALRGPTACRTTLFAKQVIWNGEVLRAFANGVVYIDLRDFSMCRRGGVAGQEHAKGTGEDGGSALPLDAMEQLLVDLIGYACRCAGVACQVASFGEALRVVHRVLFHPEAKYLIVVDHCDPDFAQFFCSFLPHTASVEAGVGKPALSCTKVLFVLSGNNVDALVGGADAFALPAVPPAAVVTAVMTAAVGAGAQEDEAVRRVEQGISKLIATTLQQRGDTDDALVLALHWARRLVKQEQHAIEEGTFALKDWRMEEVLATTVVEALFEHTRPTSLCAAPAGKRATDSVDHDVIKQRLVVLQAVLLAPLLFPVHPSRIPFHLVRLTSMMFGGLAVQQVCTTFQELVESGLLLTEYVSFATDSTSQSTLLEDAHAAMVDATGMVRVNALLLADHPVANALQHLNLAALPHETLHRLHNVDDVIAHANVSGGPAVLSDAARVAILTSLLPFVSTKPLRPESRHEGIYWETILLMASLKAHALPIEAIGLPMCSLVSTQLCSPQCLMAVLEQCSVARLCEALQDMVSVLEQLEHHIQHRHKEQQQGTAEPPSGAAIVLDARNRLRSTVDTLTAHRAAIHRNHLELWTHLRLEASHMADDDSGATPVLAVEPLHLGTIVQADAFDGTMLVVTQLATVDARALPSSLSEPSAASPPLPAVTALLFVAKKHVVVGYADGSMASIVANPAAPSVHTFVPGDRTGHGGCPITDLMVIRHGVDGDIRLVSCSRANNVAREWTGGLYDLQESVEVPLAERRGGRIYFPFAASLSETAQREQTQQHRFFSKLVRPVTNAAAIAQSYFGPSQQDIGDGTDRKAIASHTTALGACQDTTLLLQYGLPDMHRGAQFNEVMGGGGDTELNTVAITHADGLSLCASSFTLPALQGSTCSVCGEDERGHLLVVVGTSAGVVQLLRVMKEV